MAKGHARSAGTRNHLNSEELRIVVGNAEAGYIDPDDGAICLLMERDDGWGFVPVKQTEDAGLLAKSGYILTEKQKNKKLEKAETTYGI
jgi:Holliday junction resolvase-like predicted endonuclease